MYRGKSLEKVKNALKRQRKRKVIYLLLGLSVVVIGAILLLQDSIPVIRPIGLLLSVVGVVFLVLYLLIVAADPFSIGFSKSEKFKWLVDRLCHHLETYSDTKGRDFSRFWSRMYLYKIARLFPEWSWDRTKGDPFLHNDILQEDYFEFSATLRELFSRLNYSLIQRKEIEFGIFGPRFNLKIYIKGLDEGFGHMKSLDIINTGMEGLKKKDAGGVDDGFYFGPRGGIGTGVLRQLPKSPYTSIVLVDSIATLLYFPLIPYIVPDLHAEGILVVWLLLLTLISTTMTQVSTRKG